ncbi:hypothetical protein SAMN05443550_105195 [Pedobacter hartonius]|uniref:Uncharacterized protein n=1 Tax=Pedobacter hartonius TaxID=425514 RepID=A0A1H4E1E4_9SPHI|nr:hypothetical protein SAMN05443550_105195 [Pedobacter hartonius]
MHRTAWSSFAAYKNISKRLTIQSFDVRTLQILHKTEAKIKLSLLTFGNMDLSSKLSKQGLDSAGRRKVKQAILAYGKGGVVEGLKKLVLLLISIAPILSLLSRKWWAGSCNENADLTLDGW